MLRATLKLFLGILLLAPNFNSQNNLDLKLGIPDWSTTPLGISQSVTDTSETDFFLELTGPQGAWFTPWFAAYVEADPENSEQMAAQAALLAAYPWMAKNDEWTFQGQPTIISASSWGLISSLPVQISSDDEVKRHYQPILDNDSQATSEYAHFDTATANWPTWPLEVGPPMITTADFWSPCLLAPEKEDYGSRLFNSTALLVRAVQIQGGAAADSFLNSDEFATAHSLGIVHLSVQALAYMSIDPGHWVTNDPVTTGGLTGYSNGNLPIIILSPPVAVHFTPSLPVGGPGPGIDGSYELVTGSWNDLLVANPMRPMTLTVTTSYGVSYTITESESPDSPILKIGTTPGTVSIFLPTGILPDGTQGTLRITTPAGHSDDLSLPDPLRSNLTLGETSTASLFSTF